MAGHLVQALAPLQERRRQYESHPREVWDILEEGSRQAQPLLPPRNGGSLICGLVEA